MADTDLTRLRELAADDASIVSVLAGMFAEQAPALSTEIQNTITAGDATEIKKAAHTFKGVLLNLGFNDCGALCKKIEDAALADDMAEVIRLNRQLDENLVKIYPALEKYVAELSK